MDSLKRQLWVAGRTTRGAYAVAIIILMAVSFFSHLLAQAVAYAIPWVFPYVGSVAIIAEFVVAWLMIAVSARRFHDLGRTGWWQLLPFALVIGCLALAEPSWATALGLGDIAMEVAQVVALAIYLGFLLALGLVRGDPGPNRFGPSPA
jgi:uncharacterized membrane protein YhaH (DUF805 family)